jgi:MATE family multidrug resistance protein
MTESRAYASRLLRLAWPVALARLGIMGMGLVDVIVVGQFAPKELPHQALGLAPIGVLLVTGIGALTGVQVLAARAIGAGTPERAGGAWRRGMVVSAVGGAVAIALVWLLGARIFEAFGIASRLAVPSAAVARILALSIPLHLFYVTTALFLESIQRPMASTIVMWAANAVNLALNLALVPRFGAQGSAVATVGARLCLSAALVIWVLRLEDGARFGVRVRSVAPSYRALLGVGLAAAVSHAAEAGAFSGMTIIAGRIGPSAVSAYQILLNLLAAVFMVALGLASATAVLTSEAVGRKAPGDASLASITGLVLEAALLAVAAALALAFARLIGRAFTADHALAEVVAGLVWVAALVMVPDGGQVVAASALRARGDNWFPTASHLVAYALVMPALALWFGERRGQGVTGLMIAILCASLLSWTVLCSRLWRIRGATVAADDRIASERVPAPK